MTAVLAILTLLVNAQLLEVPLGVPLTVDYSIPDHLQPLPLESTGDFSVLEQRGDTVVIVPLVLDTLQLPPMRALSRDSLRMEFQPPLVTVARTMPDTTWTVPVFTSPIAMHIPPGFPADHLERHMFWLRWGRAPSRTWVLAAVPALAVLLVLTAIWMLRRRRRRGAEEEPGQEGSARLSPADEARALLDSTAFVEGRWQDYYKEVDRLLRKTVDFRFGISSSALTWRQIAAQIACDRHGQKFIDETAELTREIMLQRYAGWGGSRERARRFTEKLAEVRKEWHRR